jgi:uncharacterized repeat protein (TIGR01451 family)
MKKQLAYTGASLATSVATVALVTTPVFAWSPAGHISKYVQDETTHSQMVNANKGHALTVHPGDTLKYRVTVSDTASNDGLNYMPNVRVTDNLPNGVKSLKGDTNAHFDKIHGKQHKSYSFTAKVTSQQDGKVICNTASYHSDNTNGEDNAQKGRDQACVKVSVPPKPVYTCTGLSVSKISDKKVEAKVDYHVENGAKLKNITYNFGDNSQARTTSKTDVTHTYQNAGDYTVSANLHFVVNGKTKTVKASSNQCQQPVSFAAPTKPSKPSQPSQPSKPAAPAPKPEQPQPKVLPNTGPGAVAAIMAAASSALGYAGYLLRSKFLASRS